MARKNTDYIPTESEKALEIENRKTYMETHEDPRHKFKATYTICDRLFSEYVMAFNPNEAENHIRQQCSLVGVYLDDLKIERA